MIYVIYSIFLGLYNHWLCKIYGIFILLLLIYPFIIHIIYITSYYSINTVVSTLISLLIPLLYVNMIKYFHYDTHFTTVILYGINNREIKKLNTLSLISIILALINQISCIFTSIYIKQYCFDINNVMYIKYPYIAPLIIHKLYSYHILFSTCIYFIYILDKFNKSIYLYYKNLQDDILNNEYIFERVKNEYLILKENYDIAIKKMNNIYAIFILCCGISVYNYIYDIVINSIVVVIHDSIKNITYIILYVLYVSQTLKIYETHDKIKNIIYNSAFTNIYLHRTQIIKLDQISSVDDINRYVLIRENENSQFINWLYIKNVYSADFEKFKLLGFDISSFDNVKKIIGVIIFFISVQKIIMKV